VNACKWADMVALLVKAPRTVDELASLTKLDRTTIYRWRDALIGEGLVRAKGRTPSGARIYVWDAESVTPDRGRFSQVNVDEPPAPLLLDPNATEPGIER
jgi:hypothetical protein